MALATYFMCRSGISFAEALDAAKKESALRKAGGELMPMPFTASSGDGLSGVLFHRSDPAGEPSWAKSLESITGHKLRTGHIGTRHEAMLVLEHRNSVFVVSFNQAHHLAKRLPVIRKFGRVIVANAKEDAGLRGVKTRVFGRKPHLREDKFGGAAQIYDVDLPDALYQMAGLAAKLDCDRPLLAEGNVGVRYWCAESADELIEILDELVGWWNDGKYLDPEMAKIEHFVEIDDALERAKLDSKLDAAILAGKADEFSLSLGDERLWSAVSHGYHLSDWLDVPITDPGCIVGAMIGASKAGRDFTKLEVRSDPGDGSAHYSNLARDLVCWTWTNSKSGEVCIWDDGTWYRADADWVKGQTKEALAVVSASAALLAPVKLPPWSGGVRNTKGKAGQPVALKGEDAYIHDCRNHQFGCSACIMHREFPDATLPHAEVADLFLDSRVLLHCKGGTDFASVAEACSQAIQGAKYVASYDGYRGWAEAFHLKATGKNVDLSLVDQYVFGIALIVPPKHEKPERWSVRSLERIASLERSLRPFRNKPAVVAMIEDHSGKAQQPYRPKKKQPVAKP